MEPKYERIDGRNYKIGTPQHNAAVIAHFKRQYARNHRHLMRLDSLLERVDANQVAFLARDLVYVSRNVEKVLYKALEAASKIPVVSEIPAGAESWLYEQDDYRGEALIGASLQADDAPTVDVSTDAFTHPLLNITASYIYTVDDLEKAALGGRPLNRRKADACAEIIARGLDRVGRVGLPSMGIYGFFNNPVVPEITLTNGEWLTATPAEIIADLWQIQNAAFVNNDDVHPYETLVLPTQYEAKLWQTPINADSETTIAEWFFGTPGRPGRSRFKALERWSALDTASGADIGTDDPPLGIAYTKDPALVSWDIPITYKEEPPQARNFKFVVPARARSTGVTFRRPMSALYIKNLD